MFELDLIKKCLKSLPIRSKVLLSSVLVVLFSWWFFCLPTPLFDAPYSKVVYSSEGTLMSARIARDGQWRLPLTDTVDQKYFTAVRLFEDEYYFYHLGFNPISFAKAIWQNVSQGKIVRGASTLTMQTVRLMRKNQSRTVFEKCIEVLWALRLELKHSKKEILNMYASHAPFGGNVVGISAASWRYYGRSPQHFSWAEACALAVLPHAPGVIYPGRSQAAYKDKRDVLLQKLYEKGIIDKVQMNLSRLEPLPGKPFPLPNRASHFLDRLDSSSASSLRDDLQNQVTAILSKHHAKLHGSGIHNMAALVLDVKTGKPLAYVGNSDCSFKQQGQSVDIIQSQRSSGSILKPFLYAAALDNGMISTTTLRADVPVLIAGYSPKNFDLSFDGAVHIDEALTRSLNIPFVGLLQDFGVDPFLKQLRQIGFSSLHYTADHYGLSLILGGAEVRLWDVAHAYRSLALAVKAKGESARFPYSASSSYLTLEALTKLERPGEFEAWQYFESSRKIAWKTGTSFGFRDAWSVGVSPDYVVAVWVGNADGEGKPGLTGAKVAAPILFDIFDQVPSSTWFESPNANMEDVNLCKESGLQANPFCQSVEAVLLPSRGNRLAICPFHKSIYINDKSQRVDARCANLAEARDTVVFELPTKWAYYYRERAPAYKSLPTWASECIDMSYDKMSLVYPRGRAKELHLPRGLDGQKKAIIFEVAHAEKGRKLFWYIDQKYERSTEGKHQHSSVLTKGKHQLLVVDDKGRELQYTFKVVD